MLQIVTENREMKRYFHIIGALDISTSDTFTEKTAYIDHASEVVLDLAKLSFIDSTGIGAILELIYQLKEKNIQMNLTGLNEEMKDIFETIGVLRVMEALQRGGIECQKPQRF